MGIDEAFGGVIAEQPVEQRLLRVDPMRIRLATAGLNVRSRPPEVAAALQRSLGETLPGDWDIGGWGTGIHPIEELDLDEAMRDCILLGRAWQETRFFRRVAQRMQQGVAMWGCRTEEELLQRLDGKVRRLFEEIATNGYRTQEELGTGKPEDEIRVGIRRDGRLLFIDGRHRLMIARALALPEVPVRVVARHPEWVAFKEDLEGRGTVYEPIDHPDLRHIPARRGPEIMDLLRNGLKDLPIAGRTALDVGTHWGFVSSQLTHLGLRCTGLERNKEDAEIARRLSVATEAGFSVEEGNPFSYERANEFDVVVALSVFHHALKTDVGFERLKRFLGRLSPKALLFEPHEGRSSMQMHEAHVNFEPEEFVRFVSEQTGLRTVQLLGRPDDSIGRPVYMLTT